MKNTAQNNTKNSNKKGKRISHYAPIGFLLGAALGLLIGVITNDLITFLLIDSLFGFLIGIIADHIKK